MPSATSIVARSYPDHVIGIDNALPWHLRTDLQHFKALTEGHAIIMGRRTFESLKRPLPRRLNIVLSREEVPERPGLVWARDIPTALLLADTHAICNMSKQFYVIGGETIYKAFAGIINKVWLTEVFSGRINGDAVFDQKFDRDEWYVRAEKDYPSGEFDEYPFRITCYVRRVAQHRLRSKDEFLGSDPKVLAMLEQWSDFIEVAGNDVVDDKHQLNLF